MQIKYRKPFQKKFDHADKKIQLAFLERLDLFSKNPYHVQLNNHSLSGKYEGCRSINITGDWRAIFREFDNYSLVSFETLGTHSQLYK